MKLVVKIGGDAAENRRVRKSLAGQIAGLRKSGHDVVVVHGGGKTLSKVLATMGISAEFADGLRVTSAETRDVALMVLAGMINKQWVADIQAAGQPALGVCGGDSGLVTARKLIVRGGRGSNSLGFVGRPFKVNPSLLDWAFERRLVPVVASMAPGVKGEYFNINADDFAAAIAKSVAAERLVYLTESGGVWDAERRRLPCVHAGEIETLIRGGVVRDGMIPKLRSCAEVLSDGVGEIDIISPSVPGSLRNVLANRTHSGTRLVR